MAETNGTTKRIGAGQYIYKTGGDCYYIELIDGIWYIADVAADGINRHEAFDAADTLREAKELCDAISSFCRIK